MVLTCPIYSGVRRLMLIAFFVARSRLTCRYKRQPNTNSMINLIAAKALGLAVPSNLIALADEVIQ
jgi:hypothetical protein